MVALITGDILDGLEFFTYKLACLAIGLAFCYMGYRLFLAGFQEAGVAAPANAITLKEANTDVTIKASSKDASISVKRAAPGTCYALFGCIIIIGAVWRGYDSTISQKVNPSSVYSSPARDDLPETLPKREGSSK